MVHTGVGNRCDFSKNIHPKGMVVLLVKWELELWNGKDGPIPLKAKKTGAPVLFPFLFVASVHESMKINAWRFEKNRIVTHVEAKMHFISILSGAVWGSVEYTNQV